MFGLESIEIAIGLSLVYFTLASICSVIRERVEAYLKTRAIDLERGIRELLNDSGGNPGTGLLTRFSNYRKNTPAQVPESWTKRLYDHPLINALYKGSYADAAAGKTKGGMMPRRSNLPSYIPAGLFASALLDAVLKAPADATTPAAANAAPSITLTIGRLRESVDQLPDGDKLKRLLLAAIDAAQGDIDAVRKSLEDCFNAAMDRVSGWYKRRSQTFILLLAFVVTVAVNANTLTIMERLAIDTPLRQALVEQAKHAPEPASASSSAGAAAPGPSTAGAVPSPGASPAPGALPAKADTASAEPGDALSKLGELGLPLGWADAWPGPEGNPLAHQATMRKIDCAAGVQCAVGTFAQWWYWVLHPVLGLLLTAFAVSLGAPMWFDIMNRLISLRASLKPALPASGDASVDNKGTQSLKLVVQTPPPGTAVAYIPNQWNAGDPHAGVI